MQKFFFTFMIMVFSNNVLAEIPLIKVNCDDVLVNNTPRKSSERRLVAFWKSSAVFPNPSESHIVGDSEVSPGNKFKFSCPNYSLSYDGKVIEIKGITYEEARKVIRNKVPLYYISGYKYPNIKQGFFSSGYNFDLSNFLISSDYRTIKPGENFNLDEGYVRSVTNLGDTILGYKVNNGDLKPLLYENQVYEYYEDFENSETIDIFHKIARTPSAAIVQRIFINKPEGLIRIYYEYPFPNR